jgi:hypothetical protein
MKLRKIQSRNFDEFYSVYGYNRILIGRLNVNKELESEFIKLLCVFPFREKELRYFLTLSPNSKIGYLSRYLIRISKKVGISNSLISYYISKKLDYNKSKSKKERNSKELIKDCKIVELVKKYSDDINKENTMIELNNVTRLLCMSVFEIYDKAVLMKSISDTV